MANLDVSQIASWHAHVYFDAASRDAAREFGQVVIAQFGARIAMGRFHEKPVGPHPRWSYQVAFAPAEFADVVGWLALNHGALNVFVHPNTGDELRDHRDSAIWLGRSHQLDLRAVGADAIAGLAAIPTLRHFPARSKFRGSQPGQGRE